MIPTQGRKYASRACVQCRKKKRRCDGEDCSSCAKENIKCVMDLDTDQRRQINRNNRNTRDKLPDNLLAALRTAPVADADTLLKAIRDNASSHRLETLIEQLSKEESLPSNPGHETADYLQTPTDSESLDGRRPSYIDEYAASQNDEMTDNPHFGSASGVHISLSSSKTDRLSQVMLSFREAATSQIAGGVDAQVVLSMGGLELDLFFRERTDQDLHTISTWACEFARSWTSLSPVTQLAVIYFAGAFMRWSILPCRKTYALMSTMLRPMDGNSIVYDFSEMEYCRAHAAGWINNLTQNSHQLSWPYAYVACLEEPVAGMTHPQRFSKLFMDYCDDATNWARLPN